ncbi:CBM35 domain-containing protein [Cohnella lupini]|uniref:Carbohydrate-binding protein with CBM35 doain n=1 Tax=Cohnella lupini TaxID=1294267 RepID=A0A3D9IJK2_9BACL|nr:CBM35 domain-containing protein [Cohnella lupini]RED61885.1 carbohydrate-binding protein with CBM35 doain [Cohnella lupini]
MSIVHSAYPRIRFIGLVCLIFCLSAPMIAWPQKASAAIQATYYVSPSGSDSNSGTQSAPFLTLQKARDTVRTVNGSMTGDIVVYLRGGNYFLSNTVNFANADSGTNGFQIRYEAYPGEKPVISGGAKINGWTQDTTNPNLYKATLTRNKKLRALYVNGQRAYMTSKTISALGGYGTYSITAGQASWAWESGSQSAGTKFNGSDLPTTTRNPSDIELETQMTWNRVIVSVDSIASIGSGQVAAMLQQPYGAIAQRINWSPYNTSGSQNVYNVFEWLTSPGRFYFDRANQTVYYYPRSGENMSTAEIIAPNLETLINIQGTPITGRVQNLAFKGISFAHSDYNLYQIGNSSGAATVQAATVVTAYGNPNWHRDFYRNYDVFPGAIEVNAANNIQFLDGEVKLTGADGIVLENDVQNALISGNYIYSTGGTSVSVGHPQHVYANDPSNYQVSNGAPASKEKFAAGTEAIPKNITVSDNYILDSSKLFLGHAAITAFFTDTLNVIRNRIENTPYNGISLGWGWSNFNGNSVSTLPNIPTATAKNNNLSYNHIVNTMQVLNDAGPIYTLGSMPATTIGNNYFEGVPAGHKYAMHPDEGSAYLTMQNNVMNVNPGITWTLNSDNTSTFGYKHDLNFTQNYATVNKISNYSVPNSVIQDVNAYSDNVWPVQAYNITVNSGVSGSYRGFITPAAVPLQDYVLPASVFTGATTTSIGLKSTGDASKFVWLAPAGTTSFVEGATMTKASGTASSIAVPQTSGTYKLYIIDAQGNRSPESKYIVRVTASASGSVYEAESALLSAGAKTNSDHSGYTGSGFVDGYWLSGATSTFSVNVATAGTYRVTARYANAQNNPSTVSLYVNGTKIKQASFPRLANWDTWGNQTEVLTLNAGTNTIAYKYDSGDTGWINLDHISLAPVKFEAESAQLTGGAKVNTDHPGYTGSGFVDGYVTLGATTTFSVTASTAGNYNVTARYSNAQNNPSTVSIYVNGTKIKQSGFPRLANWDTWGNQTEALALNSGVNTITYKYETGDTGWINLDYILVQ